MRPARLARLARLARPARLAGLALAGALARATEAPAAEELPPGGLAPEGPLRGLLALPVAEEPAGGWGPLALGPLEDAELAARLRCPEREPSLERALAYWGGGPKLDARLFPEFCNRLSRNGVNSQRVAPLYAFAAILLEGSVYMRCCMGDRACEELLRGGLQQHEDLRDAVGLVQDLLKAARLETQFLLAFGDEPFTARALYSNVPVFHPLTSEAYWTIPWPSVYHVRDLLRGALDEPGDGGVAWEDKAPTAWWRGTFIAPSTTLVSTAPFLPRVRLVRLSAEAPELLDAAFSGIHPTLAAVQWGREAVERVLRDARARVVPHEEFNASATRHKYVVVVPGVTQSTQLGRVLRSGSVALVASDDLREWLHAPLEPWVHFVPLRADLSDLLPTVRWLREHDATARRIAQSAAALASERTVPSAAYCYLWRGLRGLRDLTEGQGRLMRAAAVGFAKIPDIDLGLAYAGFRPLRRRLEEAAATPNGSDHAGSGAAAHAGGEL